MLIKLTKIILKFYTSYNEMTNGTLTAAPPHFCSLTMYVEVYLWNFLFCMSVLPQVSCCLDFFIVCLEIRKYDSVNFALCLSINIFKSPCHYIYIKNKATRIIAKIYNLYINLGRSDTITILHFLTHECLTSFHLLQSSFISLLPCFIVSNVQILHVFC